MEPKPSAGEAGVEGKIKAILLFFLSHLQNACLCINLHLLKAQHLCHHVYPNMEQNPQITINNNEPFSETCFNNAELLSGCRVHGAV
jgi:hypothetical protein